MTGAFHRVGQFWRHASARVGVDERQRAQQILGPTLTPLFFELPVNDQRHGLDVLETITQLHPHSSSLLQQAALLHDAGKGGARFSVIDRSLTVFLAATSPPLLRAMLRLRPGFDQRWRLYEDHARIGAERLRSLGADELAAVVEEHHSAQPALDETRRLQEADRRH